MKSETAMPHEHPVGPSGDTGADFSFLSARQPCLIFAQRARAAAAIRSRASGESFRLRPFLAFTLVSSGAGADDNGAPPEPLRMEASSVSSRSICSAISTARLSVAMGSGLEGIREGVRDLSGIVKYLRRLAIVVLCTNLLDLRSTWLRSGDVMKGGVGHSLRGC